jgi:hypothetical protein
MSSPSLIYTKQNGRGSTRIADEQKAAADVYRETSAGLLVIPYDVQNWVVCFDKRPCFLISDLIEPLAT